MNSNQTADQFMEGSYTLIGNARHTPEVSAVLAGFGYPDERLAIGTRLWAEANALRKKQVKEYGDQFAATLDVENAMDEAVSAYAKAVKVARVAFGDNAMAAAALRLNATRKHSINGIIDQADIFYGNLLADAALLNGIGLYGYTKSKLTSEAASLRSIREKIMTQVKETGEAQQATEERDRKMKELDDWVSDLRAICKVAFYDSPQNLEKLGITVLNSPRKRAAAAVPVTLAPGSTTTTTPAK